MTNHTHTAEMLDAILHSIDEGIHAVNAEGVTIYYNPVAAKHDGLDQEEVIGKHVLEVFPSLDEHTSTLLKVIQTGKGIYHQQQSYTNMRGKNVVTVNTTLPIHVGGNVVGALEVAKDLTRIKELSDKLIDLQAQIHPPIGKATPKGNITSYYRFSDIITEDVTMKRVIELARKAAHTTSPVMVNGETGTGKELVVQSIHFESSRRDAPFIAQNCAALPPTLLESLLFGTVRGSFTGAENRPGLFELANGGTLFLDEINSMPIELQGKLLRVIQENSIRRIGDTKTIPVHVRIITASNVNLEEAIEKGAFRADLYYRLHVVALNIPPLRERSRDIPLLTQHFIQKYNERFKRVISGIDPDVLNQFMLDQWHGNVRELEHVIEAVFNIIERDYITWDDVQLVWKGNRSTANRKHNMKSHDRDTSSLLERMQEKSLPNYMEEVEQQLILEVFQQTDGNVQQTAIKLGIPRQTLQYKLKKFK